MNAEFNVKPKLRERSHCFLCLRFRLMLQNTIYQHNALRACRKCICDAYSDHLVLTLSSAFFYAIRHDSVRTVEKIPIYILVLSGSKRIFYFLQCRFRSFLFLFSHTKYGIIKKNIYFVKTKLEKISM